MSISYGALAGLIAAVAFLILVLFTLPLIVRATKTMKKVDSTMDSVNTAVDDLTKQTAVLMKQSEDLLSNALLADVNGKVTELEPVVKAAADLGESVSDINSSSRRMIERFSGMGIRGAGIGIFSSLVSRMFARRKRRRGED